MDERISLNKNCSKYFVHTGGLRIFNTLEEAEKYLVEWDLAKFFEVGDGATVSWYTDRDAGTIITVSKNKKKVTWQQDIATINPLFKPDFRAGGFCGTVVNQGEQNYIYKRNPNGVTRSFSLRKRGVWVEVNCPASSGLTLHKGRHEFYDYNF